MKMFGIDTLDWRQIKIDWDAITDDIIKAGTPMDKDGHICNDGNVFGILMDDVQRKRNVQGRVVISGCMDMKAAEKHSGITLSAEAKAALPDVWTQTGGVSSWNDLTDKPFYEETTTVQGDTLTWDGNTEGKLTLAIPGYTGAMFVQISDAVPTLEDCTNGIVEKSSNGHVSTWSYDQLINTFYPQTGVLCTEGITVIPTDNYLLNAYGVTFSKAGVYATYMDGMEAHLASLTIPGYTGFVTTETVVQPIDPKFLPKGVPYVEKGYGEILPETTVEIDLSEGGGVIPTALPLESGNKYTVTWNGVDYECVCAGADEVYLGNGAVIGEEYSEYPFLIMSMAEAEATVVAALDGSSSVTVSISDEVEVIHHINPKCLPKVSDLSADWIAELKTALGIG